MAYTQIFSRSHFGLSGIIFSRFISYQTPQVRIFSDNSKDFAFDYLIQHVILDEKFIQNIHKFDQKEN